MSAQVPPEGRCARCGRDLEPLHWGEINRVRYCHRDDQDPTCYMLASWESDYGFPALELSPEGARKFAEMVAQPGDPEALRRRINRLMGELEKTYPARKAAAERHRRKVV